MNIRAHRCDSDGLSVTTPKGTFSVTTADILARYSLETGTRAQRRAKVIAWLKSQMEATAGAENIAIAGVTFDFDENSGSPRTLEMAY